MSLAPSILLIFLLPLVLAACGTDAQLESSSSRYRDPSGDFRIDVPADVEIRHDFVRDYFTNGSWKAFAPAGSQGEPRLALVLPGSNTVTRAELRIGISTQPEALAHCSDQPASAVPDSADHRRLDGVDFVHFRAGDAAMNHYLKVDAYRAVHAGRCYAIDLLIAGTNPQVYAPPATPPFSQQQARQRLDALLEGFGF